MMSTDNHEMKQKRIEPLKQLQVDLEMVVDPHEKLQAILDFMQKVLRSQKVWLKDFWEAKKLCGPLFKEKLDPNKRRHLWTLFIELSEEAKRVKGIKEEQAAFSIEQIELAIQGLTQELSSLEETLLQQPLITLPKSAHTLKIDLQKYREFEREINLLSTMISRLNGLRKEVLATEMRISHKNNLLKSLSGLGDVLFPKRKELIQKVSEDFIRDVKAFSTQDSFKQTDMSKAPPSLFLNRIKGFQSLAKQLSLHADAFNQSRTLLSELWDQMKGKEEESRSLMEEKEEENRKNYELFLPKLEAFERLISDLGPSERRQILVELGNIQEELKGVELLRDHLREVRGRIQKAEALALEKVASFEEKEKEVRRLQIEGLKAKIISLLQNFKESSESHLIESEQLLQKEYEQLSLSGIETHQFELLFLELKSLILNKKQENATSDSLEALYGERAFHLELLKAQIEAYRKELGGSSLDIEKGMVYRSLYNQAKEHLEHESRALRLLEEKIL